MEEHLTDHLTQEEEEEQPIIDMFLKILRPVWPRRLPRYSRDQRHPLPLPLRPLRSSFRLRRLLTDTAHRRHQRQRTTLPPKGVKSHTPQLENNGPETKAFYKLPQNPEVPHQNALILGYRFLPLHQ